MPTYDYVCGACGHRFEKFQRMSAGPSRKCPECKENKLKRLLGAGSGVIFKGSGFYETDYKRKSGGNGAAGTKQEPAKHDSAKSDSPKSDAPKSESSKKSE